MYNTRRVDNTCGSQSDTRTYISHCRTIHTIQQARTMATQSGTFKVPVLEKQTRDEDSRLNVSAKYRWEQVQITESLVDHHRRSRFRWSRCSHLTLVGWPQCTRPGKCLKNRRSRSRHPGTAQQLSRTYSMGSGGETSSPCHLSR